ncbi:MAG: DUF3047 domain-containing protein [Candidatus Latescibacteria bacterium]|nr:DUF3047 domain-containing protein [Candidatus Latescibacterota bacterium]
MDRQQTRQNRCVWVGKSLLGLIALCWVCVESTASPSIDGQEIIIDDFSGNHVGAFPAGWATWRKDIRLARRVYSVQQEDGNAYLHARDDGASVILRKELRSWNPKQYPILTWRWRARVLPKGGDERRRETNDSANAVYVVLSENWFHIPRTLKYVWSTTVPVGTVYRRPGIGWPYVIVLQSGPQRLGSWVSERVNVYADYRRLFGEEPPARAVGIGLMTDQNSTRAGSEGDYDDFILERR